MFFSGIFSYTPLPSIFVPSLYAQKNKSTLPERLISGRVAGNFTDFQAIMAKKQLPRWQASNFACCHRKAACFMLH
ncbi:hypothetical protein, partial [Phascolarctobacterium succinatutens]|uniref:hypothetical protein n=1 Tax=Phascolarctobacterium succinatutens TaxID=626940 RepID=UPI00307F3350